ncbi:MAG TPA: hypothetical protein VGL82_02200 [Bryobacteraceae bacterium]
MHVPGADRPNQYFIALTAKREDDEHTTTFVRPAYRAQAIFALRMTRIRENRQRTGKKVFD